jgi:hypothetical protein
LLTSQEVVIQSGDEKSDNVFRFELGNPVGSNSRNYHKLMLDRRNIYLDFIPASEERRGHQ